MKQDEYILVVEYYLKDKKNQWIIIESLASIEVIINIKQEIEAVMILW